MAAPVPSTFVNSGDGAATTSWAVTHPAYSAGDLILFHIVSDSTPTHNWGATGPDGETVFTIVDSHTASNAERVSAFGYVAAAARAQSTFTVTPSSAEQWTATVLLIPAGEFNAATPIDSVVGTGGNSSTSGPNAPTPAWTTSSAVTSGRPIVWLGVDTDPIGTSTGPAIWSQLTTVDRGAVSGTLGYRNAAAGPSESIASVNWGWFSDSSSTLGYVINEPASAGEAKSGGSSIAISASATGAGAKKARGGTTSAATATTAGAGRKAAFGASSTSVSATATGAGQKAASGGSSATVAAAAIGGGAKRASGGALAAVAVTPVAGGMKTARAGTSQVVTIDATGQTSSQSASGGSLVTTLATATGGGQKHGLALPLRCPPSVWAAQAGRFRAGARSSCYQ